MSAVLGAVARQPPAAREQEPALRFDFDPCLPALPLAFDPDAVAQIFEERWPSPSGAGRAPGGIRALGPQRVRYEPRARCVATYGLEQTGADPGRTIGVVEVTPAGLTHRLYGADPRLPWLARATSAERMRARFATLMEGGTGTGPIEACEVIPVRYEPGSHCVIRYGLRTPSGVQSYWGKLLARDGARLTRSITALHRASQTTPGMPRIPRPLAYWPDVHLLIQPSAGSSELHARAFDLAVDSAQRERWLREVGERLAALHTSAGARGPRRTFEDDLRELGTYRVPITQVAPALGVRFGEGIGVLAALARGPAATVPVASHGAFRTDQLLIGDDGLTMLDLDSFCWASPARDLGNFLGYLRWKAIRQPQHAAFIERASSAFLDGYAAAGLRVDEDWLQLYTAAAMLKIAGRRFRSLSVREWAQVPRLLDEALQIACASANLPMLRAALDGERTATKLGPLLRTPGETSHPPDIAADLITFKKDSRGLIRYEAVGTGGERPRTLYAKLYREASQGTRVFETMRTLWTDIFPPAGEVRVPQPLGFDPGLSMLVYVPAEGRSLDEVILSSDGPRGMRLAATWLSTLHRSRLPLDRRFRMATELANLQEWAALVGQTHARQAAAAIALARRLAEYADGLRLRTDVPIHKDFHYEHLLVDGDGRLTVLDLDEMRLGDPAFDLAHFCTYLDLLAYRKGGPASDHARLRGVFLDAYARLTGWAPDARFKFFYAYTCVKIAKQLSTLRGPRPWPEGAEQRRQVRLTLQWGLAALSRDTGVRAKPA